MNMEYCPESWLNTSQALERLRTLTGLTMGSRELLTLCQAELCWAYIDCAFATGVVYADQLFVRKIRGVGHCELLDIGDSSPCVAEAAGAPALTVSGSVIVRGIVWVYSSEQTRPTREEGIWRLDLGALCRPLYFKPADIVALAASIGNGGRPSREQRTSL